MIENMVLENQLMVDVFWWSYNEGKLCVRQNFEKMGPPLKQQMAGRARGDADDARNMQSIVQSAFLVVTLWCAR